VDWLFRGVVRERSPVVEDLAPAAHGVFGAVEPLPAFGELGVFAGVAGQPGSGDVGVERECGCGLGCCLYLVDMLVEVGVFCDGGKESFRACDGNESELVAALVCVRCCMCESFFDVCCGCVAGLGNGQTCVGSSEIEWAVEGCGEFYCFAGDGLAALGIDPGECFCQPAQGVESSFVVVDVNGPETPPGAALLIGASPADGRPVFAAYEDRSFTFAPGREANYRNLMVQYAITEQFQSLDGLANLLEDL